MTSEQVKGHTPTLDRTTQGDELGCHDCGRKYSDDRWVEAVVSDADWTAISPTGNTGGILCIGCMADRFVAKGMKDVPMIITSGPFRHDNKGKPDSRALNTTGGSNDR